MKEDARCACGAVGRVLRPDIDFRPRVAGAAVMEWRGGRVGQFRIALEAARTGVTTCPACQHRSCTFMLSNESGGSSPQPDLFDSSSQWK